MGRDTDEKKLFEKISMMGFDGVEIPSLDGDLDPAKIRNMLSVGRLSPIIIGGGSPETDLSSESSTTRTRGMSYVRKLIDACQKIGGDLVCGPLYSAVGVKKYLSEAERSRVLEVVAEEFKALAKYASERSIKIALEPLCRYDTHLINTVAQGKDLITKIDEENVGLLLDTFHLNIEEKSTRGAISSAGGELFHFHACENDRGTPGSGLVNWGEVKYALDALNYQNWVAIESFAPNAGPFSSAMNIWRPIEQSQDEIAEKGLAFLKDLLAKRPGFA